ncbi:GMP reductase [Mycoplasma sp. SG1]|nr:GMP reductase [Mycoplasma sp. SG1]
MPIFDYDDVQLIPRKCIVKSRTECNTKVVFGKHQFEMPIVLSNMASVVNENLCLKLAERNFFYIMHRFKCDTIAFVRKMKAKNLIVSISIGVKDIDIETLHTLKKENLIPDYITIDIAHGHSDLVQGMIKLIRELFGNEVFIIAGNVCTPQAVKELDNWGADAIKVGIGPGKVCITKIKTGFGSGGWQLSCVQWCALATKKPIIADGGVRVHGDIAKSLRFGASLVMIGSLFAAHLESPGEIVMVKGVQYKTYFGSASEYNKPEKRYLEGKKELIKLRGSLFVTLKECKEDLQSSISYAGGNKLDALKSVDYILVKLNKLIF